MRLCAKFGEWSVMKDNAVFCPHPRCPQLNTALDELRHVLNLKQLELISSFELVSSPAFLLGSRIKYLKTVCHS